jgi:TonB-linked SusC/RagA family outer membrane protein
MRNFLFFVCMVLFASQANAQNTNTTGKITDENGAPIVGASVVERGTKNGTLSSNDGTFTLKTKAKASLVISSLGYKSAQVAAGEGLQVKLQSDVNALSEVVVTALGISRDKKAISYSAQTVNAESLASGGKSNLVDDLQGKVSGVQITNTGGQAGGGSTVVIRGYNSLTGNNQPLYVVDGVPIDNTTEGGTSSQYNYPSANRAIDINPDDIENVTVLKGGAATALYGIQAANGAIIINTKMGKAGKAAIDFSYSNSAAEANKFQATTKQWLRGSGGIPTTNTSNMWGPNAFSNPVFVKAYNMMDLVGDGVVKDVTGLPIPFYPNNFENFYRTGSGMTNKYNLSVSGANEKTSYFTAVSRLDQEGLIKNNTYQKTDFIVNMSSQLSERLKLGVKLNYINTGGNRYNQGGFTNSLAYYLNTFDILTYHTVNLATGTESYWNNGQQSPMWMVNNGGEKYDVNRLLANMDLSYKVSKEVRLDYKIGMDQYSEGRKRFDKTGTWGYSSNNFTGSINEGRVANMQLNSELILHFDHKFGKDLELRSFAGQNIFYKNYDFLNDYGNSFVLPNLYDITNTQTQTISHYSYTKQTLGVYGDIQLDYKKFLFVEGTLREDWSSTLPRNNMGFTYPSVSAGYIFSEHLKAPWLTYGKIRASYAGTSNDAPVNSLQTSYNNQSPAILGNVRFSYPTTVGNPTIKPESTTQQEIGLELGLFKRKITFEGAYYSKRSFDQIIYAPASGVTGVSSTLINLGETTNKGVDANLSFNNIVDVKGFTWTSAFNFTRNRSMVVKVGENGNDQVALLYGYNTNTEIDAVKGQPFGSIYGYAWKRYGKSPSDADYLSAPLLLNASGSPQRDAVKTLLGNTSPDFILAWNNAMSYKNFNFGFTLEWKKGGDVINDYNAMITYSGKSILTDNRYYDPTVAGAPTNVLGTKIYSGVNAAGQVVNDKPTQLTKTWYTTVVYKVDENYVEDATWLRLRNIYVGYTVPQKILKPMHIKGVDLTFSGRNIWLKTRYTGVDPEVSSGGSGPNATTGMDIASIPATKSWDFSVKFKF